jgi:hypothetical protein
MHTTPARTRHPHARTQATSKRRAPIILLALCASALPSRLSLGAGFPVMLALTACGPEYGKKKVRSDVTGPLTATSHNLGTHEYRPPEYSGGHTEHDPVQFDVWCVERARVCVCARACACVRASVFARARVKFAAACFAGQATSGRCLGQVLFFMLAADEMLEGNAYVFPFQNKYDRCIGCV